MAKIALFGGSFNPPHLGHQAVVKWLLTHFEEVWVIPNLQHAFGKNVIPFEDRFELCKLAFQNLENRVKVSRVEQEIQNHQGWSINTVRHLMQQYPEHQFNWTLGSDLFHELPQWKESTTLQKLIPFFRIPRAGYEASMLPKISSSEIRSILKSGGSPAGKLSSEVYQSILKKKLYL